MKRIELVIYFESEDAADRFIEQHIGAYDNEAPIAPEVSGWALYTAEYPESNVGPAEKTLREYDARKGSQPARDPDGRRQETS